MRNTILSLKPEGVVISLIEQLGFVYKDEKNHELPFFDSLENLTVGMTAVSETIRNLRLKHISERTRYFHRHVVVEVVISYLEPSKQLDIQRVCQLFYNVRVPCIMRTIARDAQQALILKVKNMLKSPPNCGPVQLDMWRRLKPLTLE